MPLPGYVRRLILPLLFVALMAQPLVSRQRDTSTGAAAAAITAVFKRQQADWNRGDIDAFMQGYWNSPQLSFSGANGVHRGWTAVRDRYRREYPNQAAMGHLEFSELEIRSLGDDFALVLGKWHLDRESGNVGGVFSLVFQRFSEGWRITHDHTSVVTEPQH